MNKTMDDNAFNYLLERLDSIFTTPDEYWVNRTHYVDKDSTNIVCTYMGRTGLRVDCSHPLSVEQMLYLYKNYSVFIDSARGVDCYFHIIPMSEAIKLNNP